MVFGTACSNRVKMAVLYLMKLKRKLIYIDRFTYIIMSMFRIAQASIVNLAFGRLKHISS